MPARRVVLLLPHAAFTCSLHIPTAGSRCSTETRRVLPADVVVLEGILVLHMEEIRQLLNMKVYVDTDDDVRLARRWAGGRWAMNGSYAAPVRAGMWRLWQGMGLDWR